MNSKKIFGKKGKEKIRIFFLEKEMGFRGFILSVILDVKNYICLNIIIKFIMKSWVVEDRQRPGFLGDKIHVFGQRI